MAPPAKDPMSGHPGHLTPEQEEILAKFKEELKAEGWYDPAMHDDNTLLRFLRARKFDLAKSKAMFIDSMKWRKEFKVDELYENFNYTEKEKVMEFYPRFYHKTDKDGRPVYIEHLGKIDLTKLYSVTTPERQLQALVVEYERFLRDRLPATSKKEGRLIETSCTIMDLNNAGITQFWKVKNYVQQASQISQNNYPETMGKFYIINSPYIFHSIWGWIKPWLDPVTVAKITILSTDYKKTLLEQIPEENLPVSLGGTCNCAGGCMLSDEGPWKEEEAKQKATPKETANES
ncbi:hypothetical protein BT69DRAFT_1282703 [Atractiella rhizophila]|nr:hypothetical protein BT69DRAFT_1282703 [Atractiella rhizophila]